MSSFCTLKIRSILLSVKCEELQPFFFLFWFLKNVSHICIFLGDIFKGFFLLIFIKRKQKQRCVLRNTAQMLCEKYFSLGSQVLWTKGNTKKVFIELVLCRLRPLLLTKCSWQSLTTSKSLKRFILVLSFVLKRDCTRKKYGVGYSYLLFLFFVIKSV